jgi:hypothetical protein
MKDPQQTADELVEKHLQADSMCDYPELNVRRSLRLEAIQCAIKDTQNTIDALSKLILDPLGEVTNADLKIGELMEYNFKVLTILKTRL